MAAKQIGSATIRAVKPGGMLRARKAAVSLTSSAVQRITELMREEPTAIGLRVGVRERGCNGMSYTLEYATKKLPLDEHVQQDGVSVLIDAKALMSLLGTEMDYQETMLASEFVFNNPNISGTCGCGESFHL